MQTRIPSPRKTIGNIDYHISQLKYSLREAKRLRDKAKDRKELNIQLTRQRLAALPKDIRRAYPNFNSTCALRLDTDPIYNGLLSEAERYEARARTHALTISALHVASL